MQQENPSGDLKYSKTVRQPGSRLAGAYSATPDLLAGEMACHPLPRTHLHFSPQAAALGALPTLFPIIPNVQIPSDATTVCVVYMV